MKVKHITQYLFESFKDAQAKFAQEASEEEVQQYLDTFKQLAKKGTVSGQEKDIGYWIKQGWNLFKEFVDSKSQEKSKSQVKKSKKSESIIAHDDDKKIVVIPLSKDSSCYYGKNTKWCTAGDEDNKFVDYFYTGLTTTLFYIFIKDSGEKYAASYSFHREMKSMATFEFFDESDKRLDKSEFHDVTGISDKDIKDLYNKYKNEIEQARHISNTSKQTQLEILDYEPSYIRFIDKPDEALQRKAVETSPGTIQFIDDPSDEIKILTAKGLIKRNSHAYIKRLIDNPSDKVKIAIIKEFPYYIEQLKNPSEEMKLEAVKQDGGAIKYIDNPSEEMKLEAVKQNGMAIVNIDNPSEKVQMEAIKERVEAILRIKNPTEKVLSYAIEKDPTIKEFLD